MFVFPKNEKNNKPTTQGILVFIHVGCNFLLLLFLNVGVNGTKIEKSNVFYATVFMVVL